MGKIRGIGVDAVAIRRMDADRLNSRALGRLFHPSEVSQAMELTATRGEFLASRFAAKEALVKALGIGFRDISPAEIAVSVDANGKPSFVLSKDVKKRFGLDAMSIHLSLTHEEPLAVAFVVLEDTDGAL